MNKQEYLRVLGRALHRLKQEERRRQINYYDELLSDMVEDGLTEEQATAKLGDAAAVASAVLQDTAAENLRRPDPVLILGIAVTAFLLVCSIISIIGQCAPLHGSVGIIGGADGPTAIYIASSGTPWWRYGLTAILGGLTILRISRRKKR